MLEELIANKYLYENDDFGFKIKNLTENEKLDWYVRFENRKEENNGEVNEEELAFEMYRELIECSGKIKFNEIDFETFLSFINAEFLTPVANDLNRCIADLYIDIMKTGLQARKTQLEDLTLKTQLLLVEKKANDNLAIMQEQIKHEKWVKSELKRIKSIAPNQELDELNKVSRWTIFKTKLKVNKEIRKQNKREKNQ